ncbi:MAG: hypothetical protein JXA75_03745 [Candidatus Thermoplasmatota archaeon]|nr:hypothetical protein [Candidatus Thermoplasmatota archaeon]
MSEYTKTGLLLLMIAVGITLLATPVTYALYSTINLEELQGQLFSALVILMPIAILGVLAGIFYLLGAILIFCGRKEFGEKHRKYIFYCCILFCIMLGVIVLFSFSMVVSSLSLVFNAQSQNTPEHVDFFKTQVMYSLIQAFIVAVFSGLLWVLALYNLENKKGQYILLPAFVFMILTPAVNSIGSLMALDDWVQQGTLNDMYNGTIPSSSYLQLFSLSQWTGVPGLIMLLCSFMSSLLIFVALFIAYKRIKNGELTPPPPPEVISPL